MLIVRYRIAISPPYPQALCEEAMGGLRDTNKFLTESEPWKLKGDDKAEERRAVRVCVRGPPPSFQRMGCTTYTQAGRQACRQAHYHGTPHTSHRRWCA